MTQVDQALSPAGLIGAFDTPITKRDILTFPDYIPSGSHNDRAYKNRFRPIFPDGLDQDASKNCGTTRKPHDSYYLHSLRGILMHYPHTPRIVVTLAAYCKMPSGPKHEFILLRVQDYRDPRMVNHIILDRCIEEQSATLGNQLVALSSSRPNPALDLFKVSYYGDSDSLVSSCRFKGYRVLELLSSDPKAPFSLSDLTSLASVVSASEPDYHVLKAQCYWFAGSIWCCMRQLFAVLTREIASIHDPGVHSMFFNIELGLAQLHELLKEAREGIKRFQEELKKVSSFTFLWLVSIWFVDNRNFNIDT
jgi:hypothetical protein